VKRVSWMAVAMAGAACAGALLVAGCSSDSCGTRPLATYDLRLLEDSTVTLSSQGSPSQTIGVVPGDTAGSDCAFQNESGKIFPPLDVGADWVQGYFALRCDGGRAGGLDFYVNSLGDIRSWPVGTFTIVAPPDSVGADYSPNTPQQAPAGTCNPAAWFDDIVLTVTVETATGGAAPYPTLVTDDFVRTFRLDLDTSTVQPRGSNGVACDLPLAAQVSLHLTQTAADYAYDPNAPRDCNAP
jgi:hypothetical protein